MLCWGDGGGRRRRGGRDVRRGRGGRSRGSVVARWGGGIGGFSREIRERDARGCSRHAPAARHRRRHRVRDGEGHRGASGGGARGGGVRSVAAAHGFRRRGVPLAAREESTLRGVRSDRSGHFWTRPAILPGRQVRSPAAAAAAAAVDGHIRARSGATGNRSLPAGAPGLGRAPRPARDGRALARVSSEGPDGRVGRRGGLRGYRRGEPLPVFFARRGRRVPRGCSNPRDTAGGRGDDGAAPRP